MNDSFYRAFEDRHRGSRELIKSRLNVYVSFIKPLASLHRPATAIDLGCGRGEWLELLGEMGFDAHGVDLDAGMLAACRERGLHVEQADALKTLRESPADSAALISAFHMVEHLPFGAVQSLVQEALRVLQPGGLLILETPNPENLVVGASEFYLDPSHERPIPPGLLSFVVEHSGFHRNRVVRLQESAELHAASTISLLNVLNGVSPDYSVVAQKDAAIEVLSEFDASFRADYGISLATLAQHYDQQAAKRVSDIQVSLEENNQRIMRIEARLMQAETSAAQAAADLHKVLLSSSWRITAPLRFVGSRIDRFRLAVQEGRLASGSGRRFKSAMRRLKQELLQRPKLRQAALWMLKRVPALEYRLRNMSSTPAGVGVYEPNALSPRAMRIYTELKKAVETRKN